MITIRGVFDGKQIRLLEPAPVDKETHVIVTFLNEGEEWTGLEATDLLEALRGSTKHLRLYDKLMKARLEERARE